jgi:hypothetical protein
MRLELGRNSSCSGLENREYGHGDPLCWPRDTLYPQKLALTSPTCVGRSVGIVRLRTKTTAFICLIFGLLLVLPSSFQPPLLHRVSFTSSSLLFLLNVLTRIIVRPGSKRVNEASGIWRPLSDSEWSSRE